MNKTTKNLRRYNGSGLDFIDIENEFASASICLQGAQVCEYTPNDSQNLLWLSRDAVFESGTAIRGGIPICWPWFGAHANPDFPNHGLVKQALWQLVSVTENINGTEVVLTIAPDAIDTSKFPYQFELTLTLQIGKTLSLALTTKNIDDKNFSISEAFHTYFTVSHINDVSITGLQHGERIDTLTTPFTREIQQEEVLKVASETDYVYVNHDDDLGLCFANQQVNVSRTGSKTMVVWNPWIAKAKRLSHFNNDGYQTMMCLESANAFDNTVELKPGERHTMTTTISSVQK